MASVVVGAGRCGVSVPPGSCSGGTSVTTCSSSPLRPASRRRRASFCPRVSTIVSTEVVCFLPLQLVVVVVVRGGSGSPYMLRILFSRATAAQFLPELSVLCIVSMLVKKFSRIDSVCVLVKYTSRLMNVSKVSPSSL